MNRKEMLLTILAEECAETAQNVSKALRFGLSDVGPKETLPNSELIVKEFNDILALMQLLHAEGCIPQVIDLEAVALKKERVEKWMSYSSEVGTLS